MAEDWHAGHRKRLKERYQKEGLYNFSSHEILELILSYAIPRKDTNKLAHVLIKRFRNLSNVFNASTSELMLIDGIGLESATLIKLCVDICQQIQIDKVTKSRENLDTTKKQEEYCQKIFLNVNYEVLFMICLNSTGKLLSTIKLSDGTLTSSKVDVRKIVANAISTGCSGVVLTHNHPGGNVKPSNNDIVATNLVKRGLHAVDIKLIDHIIVTEKETYAMSNSDFLG